MTRRSYLMSEVQAKLREQVESLTLQLTAYKAIVNQVLAVVLNAPELEADYAHPPPIELMPTDVRDVVHAGLIQNWWLQVTRAYHNTLSVTHGPACEQGATCDMCGMCSDCGRYAGAGE